MQVSIFDEVVTQHRQSLRVDFKHHLAITLNGDLQRALGVKCADFIDYGSDDTFDIHGSCAGWRSPLTGEQKKGPDQSFHPLGGSSHAPCDAVPRDCIALRLI